MLRLRESLHNDRPNIAAFRSTIVIALDFSTLIEAILFINARILIYKKIGKDKAEDTDEADKRKTSPKFNHDL